MPDSTHQRIRLEEVLAAAPPRTLTRAEIKKIIRNAITTDRRETSLTKERFTGVLAGLLGVLGYNARDAHRFAEKLVKNHPYPPRRGKFYKK
jgi:hypothetical protein